MWQNFHLSVVTPDEPQNEDMNIIYSDLMYCTLSCFVQLHFHFFIKLIFHLVFSGINYLNIFTIQNFEDPKRLFLWHSLKEWNPFHRSCWQLATSDPGSRPGRCIPRPWRGRGRPARWPWTGRPQWRVWHPWVNFIKYIVPKS